MDIVGANDETGYTNFLGTHSNYDPRKLVDITFNEPTISLEIAQACLDHIEDINKARIAGPQALSKAIKSQRKDLLDLILERGVDLDSPSDVFGKRPLTKAIDLGNEEIIEALLQRGAKIDIKAGTSCEQVLRSKPKYFHQGILEYTIAKGKNDIAATLLIHLGKVNEIEAPDPIFQKEIMKFDQMPQEVIDKIMAHPEVKNVNKEWLEEYYRVHKAYQALKAMGV